ncbi:MAG: type II secretion system protein GspM, partial [Kiritimatiellae bacterium]|nr:type II secretion system protein GspM [Kiritimatiellia bacterium]
MKSRPQNNQKAKLMVALALGGILLLVGIWQGVVRPLMNSRKEQAARLQELQAKLQEVTRELRQAVDDRQKNIQNLIQILDISDRYI